MTRAIPARRKQAVASPVADPAGMMLGFLLARMGVEVIVLEKHTDFRRDFRGDTIHPSTLDIIHELGFLDEFLRRPHQEVRELAGQVGTETVTIADFRHVPTHCKFVALMPQWDFLDFLSSRARKFSNFDLRMQHEAVGLVRDGGRSVGVEVQTPSGLAEIRADLVVGCDGRHSVIRKASQLELIAFGVPIDVLWFHISRRGNDPEQLLGNFNYGRALVLINRNEYFQAGLLIRKGSFDETKKDGMDAFRRTLRQIAPFLGDRVDELRDWDQVKLLSVQLNRLRQWHLPGLLCIGDAAHAMSPAGGVGINLAIQDAVAAANILVEKLATDALSERDLGAVQSRREFPTRATQRLQIAVQNRVIRRVLSSAQPLMLPWPLRLLRQWPFLRRIPARVIGIGFRPEHVRTPQGTDHRR